MVLTNTVFRVISAINKAIPKDNQLILLYSNLGFRDNVAYLYNHLIDNEYNKKYKIIRSQNDKCREIIPKNVKVVSNTRDTVLLKTIVRNGIGPIPLTLSQANLQVMYLQKTTEKLRRSFYLIR